MPHKRNPVDAVLLTANGLRAAGLVATLHAAAVSQDARPAGEWHAEWRPSARCSAWPPRARMPRPTSSPGSTVEHDAIERTLAAEPRARARPRRGRCAAAGAVVDAAIARFHAVTEAAR